MKFVPQSASRFAHRSLLKINASSPTLLVVAGVVGLGASAVMAAKATRKIDPVLDAHHKARVEIGHVSQIRGEIGHGTATRENQRKLARLYMDTGWELTKIYGPAVFVGATSAISVLGGHKILRGRQLATMAAYSGLAEQFNEYRKRVVETIGEDLEKSIYEGARGEWKEGERQGEYKLQPVHDQTQADSYLRPWFDEANPNWTRDPWANKQFLTGVQSHMNNLLVLRGHLFLNEVRDALGMSKVPEGQVAGWLYGGNKDNFVDFGFLVSNNPHTVAFLNEVERTVQLNFNIDGQIYELLNNPKFNKR